MNWIIELDHQIFYWINEQGHIGLLDAVMPWWREKLTWVPFYLALAAFLLYRFRRTGLFLIIGAAMTIGVSDTVSSRVIKPAVERLRPCNDPGVQEDVVLLVDCGPGYSFTSSHATNHFALAIYLVFTLGMIFPAARIPLVLWAASIAYGQVYVGVHYPLDVIVGALVGALIGWGMACMAKSVFWVPSRWETRFETTN